MSKFSALTALTAAALAGPAAQGVIIGPYTVDSDTLHLWHFDQDDTGSPSNSQDAVNPGGVAVSNQNGATWGNPSFTGFDRAGNTSAADTSIIRSSVNTLRSVPVGANGAFTYEAMINITTSSGSQQIFAMDQNSNTPSDRPFFWRIINGEISFQNIGNGNVDSRVVIPTTGDDAFVANEWFHVAVTYDGNDDVAGNLKFYWTRVDDSRTEANLIGTGTGRDLTGTAVYGIGNAYRTVGSGVNANLEGSIDEVRLSGVARGADEFIFAVPEPSSLALIGLGGLLIARRLRA
jgi:hypothetical protein